MLVIIAMVLAAAITRAYDRGKHRSQAVYDEYSQRARERAAAREKARQDAAEAWEQRLNAAHAAGPRAPLWWAHAAGWVIAGIAAALVAGVAGAAVGAIEGARSGYAVGREGGKQGWKIAQAFAQWCKENPSTPIELAQCGRCKGWITADQLTNTAEYGRVCPDCVPPPAPEADSQGPSKESPWCESTVVHDQDKADKPRGPRCKCGAAAAPNRELCWSCLWRSADYWDQVAERGRRAQGCDGTCRNSPISPSEAIRLGLCPDCGGRRELITDFAGVHKHVPCQRCGGTGTYKRRGGGGPREKYREIRCECGTPIDKGTRCYACAYEARTKQQAKQEETSPPPIRVDSERIYPEEEQTKPKEIKNMTAIESAHVNNIDSSGENYSSTVAAMKGLASLMGEVRVRVNDLNEQITSNSLDADTLSKISDLTDEIESVEENSKALHQHVESRHQSLAAATAEAGGSQNVATKSWYDNY
jgi:hypothetical protein